MRGCTIVLADPSVILLYIYMELDIQKWCYFALCEPILWQNVRMKDLFEGGFVEGCAEKRKFLFVLGATPNLVLSPNFCFERTLYLGENNLGALGFGRLGIVRMSLQHLLCFPYLLVKIYSAITHRRRLKVKSHKSLVFFLVVACVYFLVKFSSFLTYIWRGLLRFIILLKSILRRSTIWRHFGRQFGNKASAIYNTTNFILSVFINGLSMVSLKSLNGY